MGSSRTLREGGYKADLSGVGNEKDVVKWIKGGKSEKDGCIDRWIDGSARRMMEV